MVSASKAIASIAKNQRTSTRQPASADRRVVEHHVALAFRIADALLHGVAVGKQPPGPVVIRMANSAGGRTTARRVAVDIRGRRCSAGGPVIPYGLRNATEGVPYR